MRLQERIGNIRAVGDELHFFLMYYLVQAIQIMLGAAQIEIQHDVYLADVKLLVGTTASQAEFVDLIVTNG